MEEKVLKIQKSAKSFLEARLHKFLTELPKTEEKDRSKTFKLLGKYLRMFSNLGITDFFEKSVAEILVKPLIQKIAG